MEALAGIRVLDLTQIMAGPYCTELLADLGAEVIKIERPEGGDDARRMGPAPAPNESLAFIAMNRNKYGMAVDIRTPAGQAIVRRMADMSDVVVENFRPQTLERWGLSYEHLSSNHVGLIYCSISGFGQTGPMANRGGFDLVAQAMSGIISVTGTPEHPAKCSVPLSDLNAGLYASHAILAALIYRMKTGRGQYIDASLLDSAIAYTIWETNEYWATGRSPIGLGTAHRNSAPYQTFQTSDGAIAIGAANQRNWERLVQVLGLDGLLDDPRFATNSLRFEHRQELEALLAPQFATRTTDQWLQALDAAQVPVGPVLSIEQMVNHPQVMAREMTVSYRHPVVGDVHGLGMPVKFSQTPARLRRPAPMLGQHTFYLLKTRLGMTDDQCARLEADGVVLDAHWKGEPDGADAN